MDINLEKKLRFEFLKRLYEESGGDTAKMFHSSGIAEALNLSSDESSRVQRYLIDELLIKSPGRGVVKLTHSGLKEVESALSEPDKPTEHFLPVNIINNSNIFNSNIQQGGSNNSFITNSLNPAKIDELQVIIDSLNDLHNRLDLPEDLRNELSAEIQTMEIQKKSPKPKVIIIKEALRTVKNLLEGIAGNVLSTPIIEQISRWLG